MCGGIARYARWYGLLHIDKLFDRYGVVFGAPGCWIILFCAPVLTFFVYEALFRVDFLESALGNTFTLPRSC